MTDEEDIFGSDFESTDEETAQADVAVGDQAVDDEEKTARKVCHLWTFLPQSLNQIIKSFTGCSNTFREDHRSRPCASQNDI